MCGEGKATEHPEQAREWAGYCRHYSDVATARFEAAYAWLNAHELLEPGRMAAIGYCFGGNVVFSKALEGVALDAVVSFHGSLPQDAVAQGTKVTARILVCTGGDDGLISDEPVATFQQNVRDAGADWQFISYGGARHSFTNPDADKHGMAAIGYNAKADKRSWAAMLSLFAEIWQPDIRCRLLPIPAYLLVLLAFEVLSVTLLRPSSSMQAVLILISLPRHGSPGGARSARRRRTRRRR